jgi:hypothetical protein
MTMCDIALGYRTTRSQTPSPMLTTASVTTDFAGSAKIGDWVEGHVDVHKVGGRLAFANCYLKVGDERVVHASAVFARTGAGPHRSAPLQWRPSCSCFFCTARALALGYKRCRPPAPVKARY